MLVGLESLTAALGDAGVAVAAVGGASVLVWVVIRGFHWVRDSIDVGSGSGNDWTVTDADGHVWMQGLNEDGTVWGIDMGENK